MSKFDKTSHSRAYLNANGARVHIPQKENIGPFIGTRFVKRANMYVDYKCYNDSKTTDSFTYY